MADNTPPETLAVSSAAEPNFNLVIRYLQQRKQTPVRELVFTDLDSEADSDATTKADSLPDPFELVYRYLELISGGKSAAERLGEYAWVLEEPGRLRKYLDPLWARPVVPTEPETSAGVLISQQALPPPPPPPPVIYEWGTNAFNVLQFEKGRTNIAPRSHQTHMEKKHAIAKKLYRNLGHGVSTSTLSQFSAFLLRLLTTSFA